MRWHQLEFSVRANDLPRAEALLELAGATAISLSDAADESVLEPAPGSTPIWPHIIVCALFSDEKAARTANDALLVDLVADQDSRFYQLKDNDWVGGWEQRPTTQRIGDRLRLVAAGGTDGDVNFIDVKLHMGLAFGTGDHPTTRLCLEWLDRYLVEPASVIDFGCGSGVLAIAALKLGASAAWAVDIEPQAILATKDNAELNQLADKLWVGRPEELPAIRAGVVVANILAGTLQEMAERFHQLVAPGGSIVLSGLLAMQSQDVRQAYSRFFGPFTELERDGWVCLSAPRI